MHFRASLHPNTDLKPRRRLPTSCVHTKFQARRLSVLCNALVKLSSQSYIFYAMSNIRVAQAQNRKWKYKQQTNSKNKGGISHIIHLQTSPHLSSSPCMSNNLLVGHQRDEDKAVGLINTKSILTSMEWRLRENFFGNELAGCKGQSKYRLLFSLLPVYQ